MQRHTAYTMHYYTNKLRIKTHTEDVINLKLKIELAAQNKSILNLS